ncbi:MAG: molybdopterin molybdotransferase MoeA [Bryobacteraceae bacterium]|nr:molybdopterin molybdotransferase MoeA [Bryobacteraceae bacterium]
MTVTFEEARAAVLARVAPAQPPRETVSLDTAAGRVLAQPVIADRDYPPVARSIRDGFAVRSADLPGRVHVIGEVRAGETFSGNLGLGEAVEIMTGAPIPAGADQVVMVEHVSREDEFIQTERPAAPGEFVNPQGSEARAGAVAIAAGKRLGFADVAWLATVGASECEVFVLPRVAILATGDEIVEIGETPRDNQVRNSNSYALAAQVRRTGGVPEILPIARDNLQSTRELVARGLEADLLLLSGGVSAGKYDLVERVLSEFGAEFFFDRVLIQPGQPLVFGQAKSTYFFGLPGNPASTMVTFELFARTAVGRLGGECAPAFLLPTLPLEKPFSHKPGLTRFLPAVVRGGRVAPLAWQGSSDVASLSRADCFLVADRERATWNAGDPIGVLLK